MLVDQVVLAASATESGVTAGNSAWMLISASLVLLMTPAVAFFYGGMSRQKSTLNMMMMSFGALGAIGIPAATSAASSPTRSPTSGCEEFFRPTTEHSPRVAMVTPKLSTSRSS